ncbi:MAG: hypothetical protein ACXADH_01810 [Candidatus Kariarchaeaceae archaeon]|jgi:hypothetical protein
MTKKSSSLTSTGKLLGLIGAVVAIILAIADLANLDAGVSTDPFTSFSVITSSEIRAGLSIVFAILLYFVCVGRYKILNGIILGIVVILLGLAAGYIGGLIAVVGGILIIVDSL